MFSFELVASGAFEDSRIAAPATWRVGAFEDSATAAGETGGEPIRGKTRLPVMCRRTTRRERMNDSRNGSFSPKSAAWYMSSRMAKWVVSRPQISRRTIA